MPNLLSEDQEYAIELTERIASGFSLLGCLFVISSFALSNKFRKPVNRVIFYAVWGNALMNIATLISISGVRATKSSALCQFQAFLIQWFLPADALWNVTMAINVYLTVFKKYTPEQLKRLEWKYVAINYGTTFIVAFVYCFISVDGRGGKIYGPAVLWCWVSIEWDFLRIALCYGPAWACIVIIAVIYGLAGRSIFRRRHQLENMRYSPRIAVNGDVEWIENPFTAGKGFEITVTSEFTVVEESNPATFTMNMLPNDDKRSAIENYSVMIESSARDINGTDDEAAAHVAMKLNAAAAEANRAAWSYTKTAVLFFVSLLITWVPSSINRVYSLIHPESVTWGFVYAAALVLPLMGFWNCVIYVAASQTAVKSLFMGSSSITRGQNAWHSRHRRILGNDNTQNPSSVFSTLPIGGRKSQKSFTDSVRSLTR